MTALTFPPAMAGEEVAEDPFAAAVMRAVTGCEAGLVTYRVRAEALAAALVMTPEVPLAKAIAMLPLCAVGFQNALGALAPPEVAVHLEWAGGLRINGAACGRFRAAAATDDPAEVPDWLVVGFELPLLPPDQDTGHAPDQTALMVEGCADVDPGRLVESWSRHTLNWIARWEDGEQPALHADWRGLAHGIGNDISFAGRSGKFLGIDEDFGLLLRDAATTHLFPLTSVLEPPP